MKTQLVWKRDEGFQHEEENNSNKEKEQKLNLQASGIP